MSDPAIHVENLSKSFRLRGAPASVAAYRTLREDIVTAPLRVFRRKGRPTEANTFWALRDISFEVEPGEALGVIGNNGAGKSTLLKILSRIVRPTIGNATIVGRLGSLLEVGTGFHPELTGRENIFLSGALLGMRRHEVRRRFDEIVAFAEVEQFLDTPCKRYSSGMYVRLAFSVAAHLDVNVLLVDEVLAVGDASFQRKCLGLMGDVARSGRTILFVSHDLGAVARLCARVLVLESGSIATLGPAPEAIDHYLTKVARLAAVTIDRNRLKNTTQQGVRVTDVTITGADGVAAPASGAPLRLDLHYATGAGYGAWEAGFVVVFRSPLGTELLRLSTQPISGFRVGTLGPAGVVSLSLPQLPFTAGTILVDLGISRPGSEFVIYIQQAAAIEVQPADVYGSGTSVDQTRGLLIAPHAWAHQSGQPAT